MAASTVLEKHPRKLLGALFLAWKLLLLTLAWVSPGPGYDTSTQLLFKGFGTRNVQATSSTLTSSSAGPPSGSGLAFAERIVERLTRWDGIYFASTAERGYVLEQEWAFGWGFTRMLSFLGKSMLIRELSPCSMTSGFAVILFSYHVQSGLQTQLRACITRSSIALH